VLKAICAYGPVCAYGSLYLWLFVLMAVRAFGCLCFWQFVLMALFACRTAPYNCGPLYLPYDHVLLNSANPWTLAMHWRAFLHLKESEQQYHASKKERSLGCRHATVLTVMQCTL